MSKKQLPSEPSLEHLKYQAKYLIKAHKESQQGAIVRIQQSHPRYLQSRETEIRAGKFTLSDAQLVIAREYGFASWSELKKEVNRLEDVALVPALERFQDVIRKGDVSGFQRLIKEHPGVRRKLDAPLFDFASPAIRMAVNQKNREMIEALLEEGANINKRSEWKAGSFGVLDDVEEKLGEYLISRGAIVDIHAAAGLGRVDRLKELLEKDSSLANARGGDGGTPLHFAKNVEVINVLLARNADVHIRDMDHHSTAAMWQVRNRENLYRLLEAGSRADIFMACIHGDEEMAKHILSEEPQCLSAVVGKVGFTNKTGGDIYNWKIMHRARPIPTAHEAGHHQLAEFLLGKATLQERFLALCFMEKSEKVLSLLKVHPNIVSQFSPVELEAFPDAIWFQRKEAVKILMRAGFPLTARGMDNGTPLHIAAWMGDLETTQLLIAQGADLEDANDNHGSTPLGWCCHGSRYSWNKNKGDYEGVARALLQAGAKADVPANKYGGKVTDWASPAIMEILEEFK